MATSRKRSGRSGGSSFAGLIEALPPTLSPSVAPVACRLIARAEAMGLVSVLPEDGPADFSVGRLEQALRGFESVGIGRRQLSPELDFDLRGGLDLLNDEVELSSSPSTEWRSVSDMVGTSLLAELCGIHESSIRRYLRGERSTPDEVAWRLHFLAMVCADLLTGYNHFGVRRWFERPRSALGSRAPRDLLGGDWDPDDDDPQAVARLAAGLVTMSVT